LERGRLLWSAPRQFPCEIVVSFGRPMPADSSAVEVRQAVQELETAAYRHHKQHMRPLPHALVQNARRHPFRLLMADANTPCVSYIAALMKSIYLARRLRSCWAGQRNVGSCRLRRLAAPW
jgi:acyl-[acyl-carrier-protein]-phospholipid O-acyltransferase/long-chain-fatty-acid--[acyl-carrier-protein] ligase